MPPAPPFFSFAERMVAIRSLCGVGDAPPRTAGFFGPPPMPPPVPTRLAVDTVAVADATTSAHAAGAAVIITSNKL